MHNIVSFVLLVLLAAFVTTPASAQGLASAGAYDLNSHPYTMGAASLPIGKITATPGVPGDEVLYYNGAFGPVLMILVPNAPRSGFRGIAAVPGPCIDGTFQLSFVPDRLVIADVNGDGYDDVLSTQAWTLLTEVVLGRGLSVCR
jgi:hypothetical protein